MNGPYRCATGWATPGFTLAPTYFRNQLLAAQHHYFEWNNPGYAGIPGYEEYLKRQTADVGVAEAGLAARRAT